MYLTENDSKAIDFLNNFKVATTTILINEIYKNYNVGTRRLKKLVDEGHINRERTSTGEWVYFIKKSNYLQQDILITECITHLISTGVNVEHIAYDKSIGNINIQTLLGVSYKDIKMLLIIQCNMLDCFDIEMWEEFFENKKYKEVLPIKPILVVIDNKPIQESKNFTMIKLNRNMTNIQVLKDYIESLNKCNLRNYEDCIVSSVPASKTIDIIEKYSIHACPNKKIYSYNIDFPITFRKKGGEMEYIYKIEDKFVFNPFSDDYEDINIKYRDRIKEYIKDRNDIFKFDEKYSEYIFYVLSENEKIKLKHTPKPNTKNDVNLHYYKKSDLCSGVKTLQKISKNS